MMYFTPAEENELQLDLDTKQAQRKFKKLLPSLRRLHHFKVVSTRRFISRSGNVHISVRLSVNLPIMERIALQAALGSDPKRELCNYGRARNNAPFPVLFIHPRPRT